jgi:hypothetical protein
MQTVLLLVGFTIAMILPIVLFRKFVGRWGGIDTLDEMQGTLASTVRKPYKDLTTPEPQDDSYTEKNAR